VGRRPRVPAGTPQAMAWDARNIKAKGASAARQSHSVGHLSFAQGEVLGERFNWIPQSRQGRPRPCRCLSGCRHNSTLIVRVCGNSVSSSPVGYEPRKSNPARGGSAVSPGRSVAESWVAWGEDLESRQGRHGRHSSEWRDPLSRCNLLFAKQPASPTLWDISV
jgi:hypothetical protein